MVFKTMETLTEEHTKFMMGITIKVDFGKDENVDKFRQELLVYNEFTAVMQSWPFDHVKFYA